ncbi:MAG TPA: HAMP domain-containing sensor histidine kinase [Coleofasciculaceae cyanobacterium]|jgi:signal transduction histidine kinase
MSNNHISSTEFTTLCQSQINLLSQSLGAVWSVIYLTEEMSEDVQAQLFPFAIYPPTTNQSFCELPPTKLSQIWQALQSHSIAQLLPNNLTTQKETRSTESTWKPEPTDTQQLILPLIHQDAFIGLLVTGRDDREWLQGELQQIEEIARTITIARFIELQYHWTQNELAVQENLRRIEHDRLDNLLHQLRNPLTALRTFGKLLLKRLLPDDPNSNLAKSILAQSDRFQALLEQFETESNQLATFDSQVAPHNSYSSFPLLETKINNKVDRSSFLLPSSATELTSVDLTQILEPLIATATVIATERDIELINKIPNILPEVTGDVSALREILNNLIDNALKYTPPRGKIQLDLEMAKPAMLGIAIKDTGYGIPIADREQIFERHYRGIQAQSNIPGTGLGLAIAQELATKMQGKIELISPNNLSENSPGTTFIVWIPISTHN